MKIKMVLLAAVILGILTYTLPAYAGGNREYHVEECSVLEIPVIGTISTYTSTYLSGCRLKEQTTTHVHNPLLKLLNQGDGTSVITSLTDLCDEMQWYYDADEDTLTRRSFAEILAGEDQKVSSGNSQIDMESDQIDIDSLPRFTREDLGYQKNINGFRARKIVTRFYLENTTNPILFEEYYVGKARPLYKINAARTIIQEKLQQHDDLGEGVPAFIRKLYAAVRGAEELTPPSGELVRFVILILDKDDDPGFKMTYDVQLAEMIDYEETHFSLK